MISKVNILKFGELPEIFQAAGEVIGIYAEYVGAVDKKKGLLRRHYAVKACSPQRGSMLLRIKIKGYLPCAGQISL